MGATVLIDGLGTIGNPLAQFLLNQKVRTSLGISEVIIRKYSPVKESIGMLARFQHAGAKLAVAQTRFEDFVKILKLAATPFEPAYTHEQALEKADVVIDCTKDGVGLKNKEERYLKNEKIKTFIGQGSETDFGFPYAYGHNDKELEKESGKFIWVMSCNVHSMCAILQTVSCGYTDLDNIVQARFTLQRRGADVVNKKTITTPEIGTPHGQYGGHQAEDALKLLKTLGGVADKLDIHAVANKDPQPFMHVVGVNFILKRAISPDELRRRFRENILTGLTYHTDIGGIYIEGHDWGPTGRIIVQSVLIHDSVQAPRPNELIFTCVTPQDGNPLLSSIAALAQRLDPERWRDKMKKLFHPALEQFRII